MLVYIFSTHLRSKLVSPEISTKFVDSTRFYEFELSSNQLSPKSALDIPKNPLKSQVIYFLRTEMVDIVIFGFGGGLGRFGGWQPSAAACVAIKASALPRSPLG